MIVEPNPIAGVQFLAANGDKTNDREVIEVGIAEAQIELNRIRWAPQNLLERTPDHLPAIYADSRQYFRRLFLLERQ